MKEKKENEIESLSCERGALCCTCAYRILMKCLHALLWMNEFTNERNRTKTIQPISNLYPLAHAYEWTQGIQDEDKLI